MQTGWAETGRDGQSASPIFCTCGKLAFQYSIQNLFAIVIAFMGELYRQIRRKQLKHVYMHALSVHRRVRLCWVFEPSERDQGPNALCFVRSWGLRTEARGPTPCVLHCVWYKIRLGVKPSKVFQHVPKRTWLCLKRFASRGGEHGVRPTALYPCQEGVGGFGWVFLSYPKGMEVTFSRRSLPVSLLFR